MVVGTLAMLLAASPASADYFRDQQWHLKTADVAVAQRTSQGEGVIVAVVDSGVNADHPDLKGNVLPGVDYSGEDTRGWKDTNGHGTAMAALIAGHGHGSGDGALGLAPRAKVLPMRAWKGRLTMEDSLGPAVNEAVRLGAKVISVSLGAAGDDALERAVQEALKADVVVVGSMGNRPDDFYVPYPARYPGVVAVGATDRNGKVAPVSVTGHEMVISAPGVDLLSASNTGGYRVGTGTSGATAIVAGAAALIRSRFPDLTATQVIHRLTATAKDEGAKGRDPQYGYGILDLVKALTADIDPARAQPVGPASVNPPAAPTATAKPQADASTTERAAEPDIGAPRLNSLGWTLVGFLMIIVVAGIAALARYLSRMRGPQPPDRS